MSPRRLALLLSIVTLVAASQEASGHGLYFTPKLYPSGNFPVAAVVQDFNHDGFADIASANVTDKDVSVFLNNGDGSFGSANHLAVGTSANEVANGDLDGDGNADLVVTGTSASFVYVALGRGDGTFSAFSPITVPNHPRGIAIADFNSDGIPDIATAVFGPAQSYDGQVAVLIGHGDGSFAPPVFYDLANVNATRLIAVDLNRDGKLDLAVALQHGSLGREGLGVLIGNGDGTFQHAVQSIDHVNFSDLAAADFNRDGKPDLALATTIGTVEVVLGNGDGTFQPATTYSATGLGTGNLTDTVSIADMNGDGFPDLVFASYFTAILLGDGSGGFGPPSIYAIGAGFARVGYLNHDRIPDVVGGGGGLTIAVAMGRAHGQIAAVTANPVGGSIEGINSIESADFDRDGHPDVVVGGGAQIFFLHGLGDGTLSQGTPVVDLQAVSMRAADLNGDGKQDLVAVISFGFGGFYIILGNGDGTFQDWVTMRVGTFLSEFEPVVADFNHDGKPDVALADSGLGQLDILLGNGDGTFQRAIQYDTVGTPQLPTVADYNLDGNLDIAVSHTFAGKVSIYLGHGDGTFDQPLVFNSSGAVYLAAGDLNQDGKPDLAIGGGRDGLKVVLGNGDGTFGAPETVYPDYGPVEIADIDLDGRPDIVVSAETGSSSSFVGLRGQGDGTFRAPLIFPTVLATGEFVLKDLNGDGRPEAIVGSFSHWLNVLLNITRHN